MLELLKKIAALIPEKNKAIYEAFLELLEQLCAKLAQVEAEQEATHQRLSTIAADHASVFGVVKERLAAIEKDVVERLDVQVADARVQSIDARLAALERARRSSAAAGDPDVEIRPVAFFEDIGAPRQCPHHLGPNQANPDGTCAVPGCEHAPGFDSVG